jgi:hypothetical protein
MALWLTSLLEIEVAVITGVEGAYRDCMVVGSLVVCNQALDNSLVNTFRATVCISILIGSP